MKSRSQELRDNRALFAAENGDSSRTKDDDEDENEAKFQTLGQITIHRPESRRLILQLLNSRAPFVLAKADTGFSRNVALYDTTIGWRFVNPVMEKHYGIDSMPDTAENVAAQFNIAREDQDAFALRSQQRWAEANRTGFFKGEIVAVAVPQKKGDPKLIDMDEQPRPDTTIEALARLRSIVRPDGTVTAGNASGINDGAGALLLASESALKRHSLNPRARVLGATAVGVAPRIMGFAPAPATRRILERC